MKRVKKRWRHLVRWHRRSILVDSTSKILLVGTGLALLFVLFSAAVIREYESRRLMERIDELLATVESTVRVACFVGDTTLANDVAKGLLTNQLVAGVKIIAGDQLLAERMKISNSEAADRYVVRKTVVSPFASDESVGEIELVADGDAIREQIADYSTLNSLILMLEVAVVGWFVALVMLRRVVMPIRVFSDRTRTIRIDSGERVAAPEGHADNEIGQLADNFNRMLDNMNELLVAEKAMRAELALSERRFRTLVENSPDIIARYDLDCRLVFVNAAYLRETGLSMEKVLNKNIDDSGAWRPSLSREEYRARLERVMASGVSDQLLLEWVGLEGHWVSHEMHVVAEYDADGRVVGALAIGRDVTQRKVAEQQLLHQASYDTLTGLPNRRLFGDRLVDEISRAERGRYDLAVLFIDLDRFKEVNDTLGHAIGDQLLMDAAQRIHHCVRESDTVARLAGDEFIVILPELGKVEPLERIAQHIVAVMAEAFQFGEQRAYISASIGIAVYPQDADNAETLVGCADQAMYAAKAMGRNSFSFFNASMLGDTQQRLQLAGDLHVALAAGQLQVYYQPIVEIASGRTVKAEALLRWQHPRLGMVSPEQFIPIAEETGLIHDIGAWVFREAVEVSRRWNADDGELRQISVNVSPRQIVRGNGNIGMIAHLESAGVDPAGIVVEITEGLLLEDRPEVMDTLDQLRAAGIQLALDDFGTGYSAMVYLKKFNIDFLKIDRSFVRDLESDIGDRAIVEAIIVMAHRLGLKVIAEGVETDEQCYILAAAGCEYVQGYLYANPMSAEDFLAHLVSGEL